MCSRIHIPRELHLLQRLVYVMLGSDIDIFFVVSTRNLAFWMRALISASSFSSVAIIDPNI
jgi:hypothetical protein